MSSDRELLELAALGRALRPERQRKLDKLLEPITWDWASRVRGRQNLVIERRSAVLNVLPFLDPDERARAEEWLARERHEGLWD